MSRMPQLVRKSLYKRRSCCSSYELNMVESRLLQAWRKCHRVVRFRGLDAGAPHPQVALCGRRSSGGGHQKLLNVLACTAALPTFCHFPDAATSASRLRLQKLPAMLLDSMIGLGAHQTWHQAVHGLSRGDRDDNAGCTPLRLSGVSDAAASGRRDASLTDKEVTSPVAGSRCSAPSFSIGV